MPSTTLSGELERDKYKESLELVKTAANIAAAKFPLVGNAFLFGVQIAEIQNRDEQQQQPEILQVSLSSTQAPLEASSSLEGSQDTFGTFSVPPSPPELPGSTSSSPFRGGGSTSTGLTLFQDNYASKTISLFSRSQGALIDPGFAPSREIEVCRPTEEQIEKANQSFIDGAKEFLQGIADFVIDESIEAAAQPVVDNICKLVAVPAASVGAIGGIVTFFGCEALKNFIGSKVKDGIKFINGGEAGGQMPKELKTTETPCKEERAGLKEFTLKEEEDAECYIPLRHLRTNNETTTGLMSQLQVIWRIGNKERVLTIHDPIPCDSVSREKLEELIPKSWEFGSYRSTISLQSKGELTLWNSDPDLTKEILAKISELTNGGIIEDSYKSTNRTKVVYGSGLGTLDRVIYLNIPPDGSKVTCKIWNMQEKE